MQLGLRTAPQPSAAAVHLSGDKEYQLAHGNRAGPSITGPALPSQVRRKRKFNFSQGVINT